MELWENLEIIASIYQVWLSCQFSQLMLFDQVSCHVCHPLCVPNKNSREKNFNKNSLYTYLQRLAWKMYENIGWIWQFVNAQSDFWLSSRRWCQIRAHLRVVSNIGVSYTVHAIHNVKRNYVTENVLILIRQIVNEKNRLYGSTTFVYCIRSCESATFHIFCLHRDFQNLQCSLSQWAKDCLIRFKYNAISSISRNKWRYNRDFSFVSQNHVEITKKVEFQLASIS